MNNLNNLYDVEQYFIKAGIEYARVWKDEKSNPEKQTTEALTAAATKEFENLDIEWPSNEKREYFLEVSIEAFVDGFKKH